MRKTLSKKLVVVLSAALVLGLTATSALAHYYNGYSHSHVNHQHQPASYYKTYYKHANPSNAFTDYHLKAAHGVVGVSSHDHYPVKVKKKTKTNKFQHYHDGRLHNHFYDEVHYEPVKVKKKRNMLPPKKDYYTWKAHTTNHSHSVAEAVVVKPIVKSKVYAPVVPVVTTTPVTVTAPVVTTTKPAVAPVLAPVVKTKVYQPVVKPVVVKKHYYPEYKYYDANYNYGYVYNAKPVVEKVYHKPLVKTVKYNYYQPHTSHYQSYNQYGYYHGHMHY